jgi:hypothetical protein
VYNVDNVEELYKEFLLNQYEPEGSDKEPTFDYNSKKYWDDRTDLISEDEWLETLAIHQKHRKQLIVNLIEGKNYDS